MSAYVIVDVRVTDPVLYEEYKRLTPTTVAAYGGTYLARGGRTDVFTGTWDPERLVILQFENMERARAWIDSKEYAHVHKMRNACAIVNMVALEGL